MIESKKDKKYFRIDTKTIDLVNCPLGIKTLNECKKCAFYDGLQNLYPSVYVKCKINDEKDVIKFET
jgi:hypothetical protein